MSGSLAEDYGLRTNGNGHGNGHEKVFELKRPADPETIAVLRAREKISADDRFGSPVKAWLLWAVDHCLDPGNYQRFKKGIACVADSVPAQVAGVTTRTIWNYRHTPGVEDYVWFTKEWRPDKYAMMKYHLAALHPRPAEKKVWVDSQGGAYAGGAKARSPEPDPEKSAAGREARNAALAVKRAQKVLALTGGFAVVSHPNFSTPPAGAPEGVTVENVDLQAFSAGSRSDFRPTAEKDFGSQPKKISAHSRKDFRLTAEKGFGSEPKKVSAASRKDVLPTAEKGCRYLEPERERVAPVADPKRVATGAGGAGGATRQPVTGDEKAFLEHCQQVFGEPEMEGPLPGKPKGNGALWRLRYREDKAAAWQALNETRSAVTAASRGGAKVIKKGPVHYASYLFKTYAKRNADAPRPSAPKAGPAPAKPARAAQSAGPVRPVAEAIKAMREATR